MTRRSRGRAIVMAGLLAGAAFPASGRVHAQAPATAEGEARESIVIPEGTEFDVRLDQLLGTETNEAGDRWSATLAHDITYGERLLVRGGAVVYGEVTRAGATEVEGETRNVLAVEPRDLEIAGRRYPIEASVIDAALNEHDEKFSGENIAIIGASAGAGTVLGAPLGDADEALLGAVLGGGAGTTIAVATEKTEIEFPEGSTLTLRLGAPVRVEDVEDEEGS